MKKSPQPQYIEQQDLIGLKDEGRSFQLHPDAFSAWKKMKDAARTEGISLYIVSAFRSFERQSEIIEKKREKGVSEEDILGQPEWVWSILIIFHNIFQIEW